MDEQQRASRAADNQALFRSVNERIEELNRTFEMFAPYGEWACECADLRCIERIEMTLAEYEQVRGEPERFAVAPAEAHVDYAVERVVARNERYWLVEKIGAAAVRAQELDERRA